MIRAITLLGNPVLRQKCAPVKDIGAPETQSLITDLADTLADFRRRKGFGRGIAAPQIGVARQMIFVEPEIHGPMINPRIVAKSHRKMRLWDDCFSFPDLLVMVERSFAIKVSYRDRNGTARTVSAEGALSELLQHEIDHLNGILAIDRAIDSKHIILRSERDKHAGKEPVLF